MDESERVGLPAALLEPETFRMFYDRALPVVFGYFVKRCGGRMDVAADLTQETFASAVSALRRGAQVDAPLPWIVTIARRRLVDHYRRISRGEDAHRRLEGEVVQVGLLATSAAEDRVLRALAALPTHFRLVLVLRYVDGLQVAEVAVQIGKSVRAVESLLVRARAALSKTYEETRDG
jgi:RNA polymerase sigma-70 factor (ECF subfamily)